MFGNFIGCLPAVWFRSKGRLRFCFGGAKNGTRGTFLQTLVPRSLLRNRTKTLVREQAVRHKRESGGGGGGGGGRLTELEKGGS